jgi:ribonuclease BN (tRNA processing enzyme)
VLAHDCSFPDGVDVSNHPTPSSLGRVLSNADADVGRVYLTHLYPHTDGEHEAMLESLGERYDGDVRFARDGLSLDIE